MNELLREELYEVHNIQLDIYTGEIEEDKAKERFKIKDLESANWAFRKLKAIEEKEKEITDLMNKEIKRIQDWAKEDIDKLNDSKNFFESLLMEYYVVNKELDSSFKVSTPFGKISSRKQQPQWIYDNDKVIDWLLKNDKDLIRTKHEPIKTDIKNKYQVVGDKVVTEDGEIVEGITVEASPDSIIIKVVE